MSLLRLLSVLGVAVFMCSCSSSLKVAASKEDPSKLKKYRTYAWVAPGDTALNSRRDDKIYAGVIEKSANEELARKGMTIDISNPDVVFMFDTRIDEKVATRAAPSSGPVATGYGGYACGYNGSAYYSGAYNPMQGLETSSILINEGTLSYSMFDRKTGERVWQGWATSDIGKKTNVGATIKRATKFIFAKLPIDHK